MAERLSRTICIAAALLFAATVAAQTERGGGSGGDSQRIMQQYQQLAAERTTLKAQLGDLQKELDSAKADLAATRKERDELKGRAAQLAPLTVAKDTAEKNLEQNRERTAELVAKFRETVASLKDVEADRGRVQADLVRRNDAFDTCATDNLSLYEISGQVLDRYENVGFFTRVAASDPFLRVTHTRIENLVDEYRARAQELRVKKPQ
jgi:chromosome segregation ATPase